MCAHAALKHLDIKWSLERAGDNNPNTPYGTIQMLLFEPYFFNHKRATEVDR